jgi:acetyl-CoA C-acetyltransferase
LHYQTSIGDFFHSFEYTILDELLRQGGLLSHGKLVLLWLATARCALWIGYESSHHSDSVMSYIVSAARTPIGALLGSLQDFSAPQLGAIAIKAAVERAGLNGDNIDEVIMGNVLAGGVGQAPARQAAIYAGLPTSVACLTINKVCGSGLKSVMLADQAIRAGDAGIIVAGGQESMTNAPHAMLDSRKGVKFGNARMVDLMQWDGLWDVYNQVPMGDAAELCASECNISREQQDEFTIASYKRAQQAQADGWFSDEIVPVVVKGRKGDVTIDTDEEPGRVVFDKIPSLKPVFKKDGTVTAANASTINDGAAALVVASEAAVSAHGLTPMARIVAQVSFAHDPLHFTTAPVHAISRVVEKAGLSLADIDLFEVNEAFAVVNLAAQQALQIPLDRMNVHGGAVALGHPIGASGARILTTLLYALRRHGKRYGLATLCIGGGEASALIVERI